MTVSRRERPAKPPLSRDWIIAETIAIMRSEGLAAATMRRVAQALDTGPSSLYVYVANTTELHAAVLDELMGTLTVRGRGNSAARLRRLLADYRDLLLGNPGLARSALTLRPSGPNTIRFFDLMLGLLLDTGLPADRAAWVCDLLMLYVTALSAEHSAPAPEDRADHREQAGRDLFAAVAQADHQQRPHVAQLTELLLGGTPEQRWDWALTILLTGAQHTPTPLPAPTSGQKPSPVRKPS